MLLTQIGSVLSDVFTSMAHMESLLDIEKDIPQLIQNYISNEKARIEQLKR